MNKIIITLISIFTVGLLISSATAVPNTNSETVINKINNFEKFTTIISTLKEKIKNIQSSLVSVDLNTKDTGQILAIIVIIVIAAAIVGTSPLWWWPIITFLLIFFTSFFIFLIIRSIIQVIIS